MALISTTSGGSASGQVRGGAGRSQKTSGFWESQKLAKQRSYEKKSKTAKVKLPELTVFTQQLASMLEAGLPLVAALEALQEQTENPVFQIIIRDVRQDIAGGTSFSDAVKKYPRAFNYLFVSMVEAGEASGSLPNILGKVAEYFEETVNLNRKVKSAMTYPVAVIIIAFILVNFMLIVIIPGFGEMFTDFGADLPAPTQILIDVSNWLRGNIIFVIPAMVGVFFIIKKFLSTPRGRRMKDANLYRLPIFGNLIHKIALSRFSRTYAILMRSGVPILQALEIVSSASNNVMVEDACKDIARAVSQGGQVSDVLASDEYFPPMMKHMVRAGEQTGNVDGMMTKVADFYDSEVSTIVAGLTSLIEPLLIVFLGVVVGGIVIAMFLPIFELSNVVAD